MGEFSIPLKIGADMRKKRLAYNTISSLVFQLVTIISGFILPRLILGFYGSEINGLVNSITQFLQMISFLELGIGAVVQSALYKPLADKDNIKISQIITSASRFFKRLAQILLVYVVALIIFYPLIVGKFDFLFTALLISAMSISSFAQYYLAVVDKLLLNADQHGYIQYNIQTIAVILNTIACVILIKIGASIQVVRLTTSLIYLIRPLYLRYYVNKNYRINRQAHYDTEPIPQKWNGVAQHVAAIILDSTDNIVLTLFATLSDVSIYSVYYLVVFGVKQIIQSLTSGIQSLMGELWARQEREGLLSFFSRMEWIVHTGTVFVFSCTWILIVPFVKVYTYGINDANYAQPLFASLMTAANMVHCLRLPYVTMVLAAGHYKQTQKNYIISAALNIIISIVMVKGLGLIGVAIGTLVSMMYQTLWMAIYGARHLVRRPLFSLFKQFATDITSLILSILATSAVTLSETTYASWVVMAIKVVLLVGATQAVVNIMLYKDNCMNLIRRISNSKGEKEG